MSAACLAVLALRTGLAFRDMRSLQQIGPRLAETLRRGDVLARLGGDQFVLLLHPADTDTAIRVAERVQLELQRPIVLPDVRLQVGLSIGIAVSNDPVVDDVALLQHADIALYRAKSSRSGHAVFDRDLDGSVADRLRMVGGPSRRLRVRPVGPPLPAEDGSPPEAGYGGRGFGSLGTPDAWTAVSGRIPAPGRASRPQRGLTTTVLGLALRQAKQFQRCGMPLGVAVNISPANLLDFELPDQISELLSGAGYRLWCWLWRSQSTA